MLPFSGCCQSWFLSLLFFQTYLGVVSSYLGVVLRCSEYTPLPNWHICKMSASICLISVAVLQHNCNKVYNICKISA
jgi:hypothetical protein